MKTAIFGSRTNSLLKDFGATVWQTHITIRSPQCRSFTALKDVNLIYVVAHLTALREFTGKDDVVIELSRVDLGTKVVARTKRHEILISNKKGYLSNGDEGPLLHYLFMGLIKTLKGKLTVESMGRSKTFYYENDGFHEDHGSSPVIFKGTRITAFIPAYF